MLRELARVVADAWRRWWWRDEHHYRSGTCIDARACMENRRHVVPQGGEVSQ